MWRCCGYRMWWKFLLLLSWLTLSMAVAASQWLCPEVKTPAQVHCACDMPHTLLCTGTQTPNSLEVIPYVTSQLRNLSPSQRISLLDLSIQHIERMPDYVFENVSLHGLMVSSGELSVVSQYAFYGLEKYLVALGLPANKLTTVPSAAVQRLDRLERLDLSSNKIKTLPSLALRGLKRLETLDLSDNGLQSLDRDALVFQSKLQTLILDKNKVDASQLTFRGLDSLSHLSLRRNFLKGSISNTTFPAMPRLQTLVLAENNFTSIRRGALKGLSTLRELDLSANQIDVIEDHAFLHLKRLQKLDMSHNGIVTVSGFSLAHLSSLRVLDMSHNYLRAITADLAPNPGIQVLNLQDNDMSIIQPGVFANATRMKRLILTDNPFHCDCRILDFAVWLKENPSLSTEDKMSALCATPPQLENGVLVDIPEDKLTCGGDDTEELPLFDEASEEVQVFNDKIELKSIFYEGSNLRLVWDVSPRTKPYACDTMFIYQEIGNKEMLLESFQLSCTSAEQQDSSHLDLSIQDVELEEGKRYRFCITLADEKKADPASVDVGCTEPIHLYSFSTTTTEENRQDRPRVSYTNSQGSTGRPVITAFYSNITTSDTVSAYMRMIPEHSKSPNCNLTLVAFANGKAVSFQSLNCSVVQYTFTQLHSNEDSYRVCATFDLVEPSSLLGLSPQVTSLDNIREFNMSFDQCIDTMKQPYSLLSQPHLLNILIAIIFALFSAILLIGIYIVARKLCISTHPKGVKYLQYCSRRRPSSLEDINYDDSAAKDDFSKI